MVYFLADPGDVILRQATSKVFADCISSFYDEFVRTGRLQESQKLLTQLFESDAALTFSPLDLNSPLSVFDPLHIPEQSFQDYSAYYYDKDIWMPKVLASKSGAGSIIIGEDLIAANSVLRSEFYYDFLRQYSISNVLCGIVSDDHDPYLPRIHCCVYKPDYRTRYTSEHRTMFSLLVEKLRSAMLLRIKLGGQLYPVRRDDFELDLVPWSLFLIDRDGKLVYLNRAAERCLRTNGWMRVQGNRIRLSNADLDERLQKYVGRVMASQDSPNHQSGAAMTINDTDGSSTHVEIRAAPMEFGNEIPCDNRFAVLLIDSRRRDFAKLFHVLNEAFGLTKAEVQISLAINAGESLEYYSQRRHISLHTARTQLKHALSKTDTHKQTELAALIRKFIDL